MGSATVTSPLPSGLTAIRQPTLLPSSSRLTFLTAPLVTVKARSRSVRKLTDSGFDDREVLELMLEPGHRSPLYRSSHLASRFALGLAAGQEWSHFYYLNGGAEIARVKVPDWLADDPELLAVSHAMMVKQCQLGLGYPVAISEAHEQAVITGHDREEFRRMTLMLLEQRGLPTPESAKSFSKRRPWV